MTHESHTPSPDEMGVPLGETGHIEQERVPENPLWELLPTLKRFTPEERGIIDQYVRESIQDIGAVRVIKKLIMGTPNDYSILLAQSKEDRPDIMGENAVELKFTKQGWITDRSSRQTEVSLTALVQKDSPLLKLADPRHPHSNLLDTVLRVAAMYLDNPPNKSRSMLSLLDNPEFDNVAFGFSNLKQTIPAKDNHTFQRDADNRWTNHSASREEFENYINQPTISGGKKRWEFYGEIWNNPDFQTYRAALLGPVEPIKHSAQERARIEHTRQEEKQRKSKEVLNDLAEGIQELFKLVQDTSAIVQKAGEKIQGGSKKGNELLEVVFNDPSAKVRAEVFDWQPAGEGGSRVKGRRKYVFEILSDAQAAKDRIAARVEICLRKPGEEKDRVITIPLRENTSTKELRPIVGVYDGTRIDGEAFDIELGGIGRINRVVQSHEEFQEVISQANKKVADILIHLRRP